MDTLDAIKKRRSIRKYLDVPVEWYKVTKILEAGKQAPSSGNLQNWRFIIVTDKKMRRKLAEASLQQYWMESAPVHIVVCSQLTIAKQFYGLRGERFYTIQNCAAAIQNMLLAAHSLGLGSCWVGAFDEGKLKTLLDIPEDVRPEAIITIGYPDENPEEPEEYELYDVVFLENYGRRIRNINLAKGIYSSSVVEGIKHITKKIKQKIGKKGKKR